MLKIVVTMFLFLFTFPFMAVLAWIFPLLRHIYFTGMLFFTCKEVSFGLMVIKDWKGTARAYTFTAVFFFAVPLFFSMVLDWKTKVRFFPPGSIFYFLYFLSVLISGVNAIYIHQWGFEVYRMFWMYFVFLAAFNYLNNCKDLIFFIYLVCFILIYLFLVGFDQKYRLGSVQVHSTFPHQNSLALYLELLGLLSFGVLLNEHMSKLLFCLCMIAFGSSVLLILFTYSRGALVIYFGGIAIVCAASMLFNGFSVRRLTLLLIGMIVMLCVVGYALPNIIKRFTGASPASKKTRIALAIAAKEMANDYTLGVGANHFGEYSGFKYQYTVKEEYGYSPISEKGGIVETIYMLVAAECGWYGLGLLILWFFYYYVSLIISMFVLRKKPCSGIVIGLFGGLTCIYWHSTLEWSMKQPNNFSEQMVIYGLIAAIAVNRKKIKAAYQRQLAREAEQEEKRKKKDEKLLASQYSLPLLPGRQFMLSVDTDSLRSQIPPTMKPVDTAPESSDAQNEQNQN